MELELEKEDDDCSLLDEVEELEQLLERDIELDDDELSWEVEVLELEEDKLENEQFDRNEDEELLLEQENLLD